MNNDLVEKLTYLENEQAEMHTRVGNLTERLNKIEVEKKQTVKIFL
jgi:hypothetical protein